METTPLINLETIAKRLKLALPSVRHTAELLEEGNTVPFITRFRKDQTGGLDEQQVRTIEKELNRANLLLERKEAILKSIESRGKLTDELAAQINAAKAMRELEDTYLPYKPKKQSLASIARSRGLEPLAISIMEATSATPSIDEQAVAYIDEAKSLPDADAVFEGLKHLIAEHFGNHRELRAKLRNHLSQHGKLVSKKIDQPVAEANEKSPTEVIPAEEKEKVVSSTTPQAEPEAVVPNQLSTETTVNVATEVAAPQVANKTTSPTDAVEPTTSSAETPETAVATKTKPPEKTKQADSDAVSRRDQRRETRRRRRERLVQSFKDYFDFSDPIKRIPHHRILAINRGERTKVLRVKIECSEWDKIQAEVESTAIPAGHPHADFLRVCLQDAMTRLLVPSIEREVRRELNDNAEDHAVSVFARNLRKLLLQPPLRQHRVVAIDPGFRSGCKLVALDEFGQVLGHTFINLLGKEQQKQTGREDLAKFVQEHKTTVVAVGNGAACRETETLVAEVLGNELKDQNISYLIVNEAGTSVYSTSELGREELPDVDATVRSAVSIGRRSLDPLSELVKIDPASIGVGLYQHDVKAKHLRESLDDVVESCVNYVGVDVNSASPALLRYVSGLNSLTARKIYEHRQANGPFQNREQLKSVSGVGDASYVQAAGFLKIVNGDNPLDRTWIHPESYPAAVKVLEAIGFSVDDLRDGSRPSEHESAASVATAPPHTDPTPPEQIPIADAETTSPPPAASNASPTEASTCDVKPEDSDIASPAKNTDARTGTSERADRMKALTEKLATVDVDQLAPEVGVGKLSLRDILNALARPGRDPREDLPPPIFRTGILKLEDLKPEMELSGTVLNVVDFGAFVDIGLVDSGLVHVSRLADRFVSDPHDVVSVGDILRVWVVEVDQKRRRVSLTAIEPGTEKPKQAKPAKDQRRRKPRSENKDRPKSKKFSRGKGHKPNQFKPKTTPKPTVPITKEMESGKEPMRTFGDLKQLFEKKKKGG